MSLYQHDKNSPRAEQPLDISLELKPHQLASLYRMRLLDKNCGLKTDNEKVHSNIGILADLAGYGKTITLLALIQELKEHNLEWMPRVKTFINNGFGIAITQQRRVNHIGTSLIVVPDQLTEHWQYHLDTWTELTFELVDNENCKKIIIEDYDVILCPARQYNNFVKDNQECRWNRVVFDEADSIHLPNTEYVQTRFLWLVSATFQNIPKRKNKGYLRDIFKPQEQHQDPLIFFYPCIIKGVDHFVKKSFDLIPPDVKYIECMTPGYIKAVKGNVTNYILELVSAGDLNGAILELGGNVNTDNDIIELLTANLNNEIKALPKNSPELESLLIRKARLEKAIQDLRDDNCSICFDRFNYPTVVPCCKNIFCAECILKWRKNNNNCPLCRTDFDLSELCTISKPTIPNKFSKIQTILNIIRDKPDGRYIIFSGHSATFEEIARQLTENNYLFGILTTVGETESTLEKFRNGEISVILLNAKHNGAGLEIPHATDIILYHQMSKNLEIQAIARAQRPGRSCQLCVWKLQYQHEYATHPPGLQGGGPF